jgi:hypothetical protein
MRLAAAGAGASSSGYAGRAGPLRLENKKPEDTDDGRKMTSLMMKQDKKLIFAGFCSSLLSALLLYAGGLICV